MPSALSQQLQAKLISSCGGVRFLRTTHSLHQLFGYSPGRRSHVSMQLSRTLSGLTNLLFNKGHLDELTNGKRKRLRPGKVSPPRPVPEHIPRKAIHQQIILNGLHQNLFFGTKLIQICTDWDDLDISKLVLLWRNTKQRDKDQPTILPVCDLGSGKQIHAHIRKNSVSLVLPV